MANSFCHQASLPNYRYFKLNTPQTEFLICALLSPLTPLFLAHLTFNLSTNPIGSPFKTSRIISQSFYCFQCGLNHFLGNSKGFLPSSPTSTLVHLQSVLYIATGTFLFITNSCNSVLTAQTLKGYPFHLKQKSKAFGHASVPPPTPTPLRFHLLQFAPLQQL